MLVREARGLVEGSSVLVWRASNPLGAQWLSGEFVQVSEDALGNPMVLVKIFPVPAEPTVSEESWEFVEDVEVVSP